MKPELAPRAHRAEKLRIAYLIQQFPVPTQAFAASDIAALREAGHRVQVYTMKPGSCALGAAEEGVMRPSWRGMLRWPLALWQMRAGLARIMRRIVKAGFRNPSTALAALACVPRAAEIAADISAQGCDIAHLFWARHTALVLALLEGSDAPALRSVFVGAYDLVADDFLVEMALAAAEIVFSHAEANRAFLEQRAAPGTQIAIVRRGIPLEPIGAGPVRDPDLWITASALVAEKNVDGVIRAFAHARKTRPGLRLRIFGDGPERGRLERYRDSLGCQDAVHFEGHVERQALRREMQRADTFLLLSTKPSERLPNVVKEALWAGCAVISSNSEGIEELLPDAELGQVVDPGNQGAVDAAVDAVLRRDPSREAQRIARARAFIAEHYSAERNMQAYVEAWSRPRSLEGTEGSASLPMDLAP